MCTCAVNGWRALTQYSRKSRSVRWRQEWRFLGWQATNGSWHQLLNGTTKPWAHSRHLGTCEVCRCEWDLILCTLVWGVSMRPVCGREDSWLLYFLFFQELVKSISNIDRYARMHTYTYMTIFSMWCCGQGTHNRDTNQPRDHHARMHIPAYTWQFSASGAENQAHIIVTRNNVHVRKRDQPHHNLPSQPTFPAHFKEKDARQTVHSARALTSDMASTALAALRRVSSSRCSVAW